MISYFRRISKAPTIITHGMSIWGGGSTPILNYWKYQVSNKKATYLIIRSSNFGFFKSILACLFSPIILIDGLHTFSYWDILLISILKKKTLISLHEAKFALAKFKKENRIKHQLLKLILKKRKLLCASEYQRDFLSKEYAIQRSEVIYEPIEQKLSVSKSDSITNIIMVGYWMERKGVNLFSKLADYCFESGMKVQFSWVGTGNKSNLYFSDHVKWLPETAYVNEFIRSADLFFLSSIDEPLGLSCLEAIRQSKKCVVYKDTGIAELIRNIDGCAIYKEHSVSSAFDALKTALESDLDIQQLDSVANKLNLKNYASRINALLDR